MEHIKHEAVAKARAQAYKRKTFRERDLLRYVWQEARAAAVINAHMKRVSNRSLKKKRLLVRSPDLCFCLPASVWRCRGSGSVAASSCRRCRSVRR